MSAYKIIGSWTNQDLLDAEDNENPERFVWDHQKKTVRVKSRRADEKETTLRGRYQ
jgi:hypothetical protein